MNPGDDVLLMGAVGAVGLLVALALVAGSVWDFIWKYIP